MRYTNGQSLFKRGRSESAYGCTINHIVVCYDELISCGVTGIWNFFKEQSIRRPVKLSLKQIRNADLSANEVVHDELQPLQRDETRVKIGVVSGAKGDVLTVVAGL